MKQRKQVLGIYGPGSNHWVGDGFPVRNLFPSNGVADQINPFLMLDYAGPAAFAPSKTPRGVDELGSARGVIDDLRHGAHSTVCVTTVVQSPTIGA